MSYKIESPESSTPTFGPNHEAFNAINAFSRDLTEFKGKVLEMERLGSQTEVLCRAYKDLHSFRLIFLFATTGLFVLSSFAVMYLIGSKYSELDWILRFIAGTTGVGLIIECV